MADKPAIDRRKIGRRKMDFYLFDKERLQGEIKELKEEIDVRKANLPILMIMITGFLAADPLRFDGQLLLSYIAMFASGLGYGVLMVTLTFGQGKALKPVIAIPLVFVGALYYFSPDNHGLAVFIGSALLFATIAKSIVQKVEKEIYALEAELRELEANKPEFGT